MWQEIESDIESTPFTRTIYFMVSEELWNKVLFKEPRQNCGRQILFPEHASLLAKNIYREPVKRAKLFDWNSPEWIGLIISRVVYCWNKLAILARSKYVEDLISDVILFDQEVCKFVVIPEGCGPSPKVQKNQFVALGRNAVQLRSALKGKSIWKQSENQHQIAFLVTCITLSISLHHVLRRWKISFMTTFCMKKRPQYLEQMWWYRLVWCLRLKNWIKVFLWNRKKLYRKHSSTSQLKRDWVSKTNRDTWLAGDSY